MNMTTEEKLASAYVATVCQYRGKVVDKLDKWLESRSEKDFDDLVRQHNHSKEAEAKMDMARKKQRESQWQ
jgi:hypothetical protein